MMKIFFLFLTSIVVAFVFDIIFGQIGQGIIPPLVVGVVCYWFWRLDLGSRLFISFVLGAILDTVGFLSGGVYTLIFVCIAFLCGPMKTFFSNTESRIVIMLNVIILVAIFRLLIFPASLLIEFLAALL